MVEPAAPAQQGQPTPAQPAQNQQLALLLQILAVLRGVSSVSMTNPNLVYNYGVAVTPNLYTSSFVGNIIQQLIPAPFGPLIAPFLGGLAADYLAPASYSILPWNRTYINPAGASGLGFAQSITYKRRVQLLSTLTIFNRALNEATGGKFKDKGLDSVLLFFGLDLQQKSATRAAVAGSASIMLSRYGTDAKLNSALLGVALASALAAAGRYYGNFSGQNIGLLSQVLAARGAFDLFVGDKAPKDAADKVKTKIRDLSRALLPLRDIFGNDIKALVSSVLTLYGTGIDALGPDRLLQISNNIRGTMYATGARMLIIQKAQESAVEYRRALAPDSSPNLVFNDLNAALTYTMRTERARSSAFMSTDDYRNATMRDIVATGTSSYADMVNKAYGAWVQRNQNSDKTSVKDFLNAVATEMTNNSISRTQAILNLAGKTHPALLMRTALSDYALRSGLGARLAYTQNYLDRLRDVQAKHTMFLGSDTAASIDTALKTLGTSGLSDIYALRDDKNAFREYLNAKNITDATVQNTLYNIAVDTQGGNSVAAMAHAQVTQLRALDLKLKLDKLGAKYRKAQAQLGKPDGDRTMFSSTGIWSLLRSGGLEKEDADALLELAGLSDSFSYTKDNGIKGQVVGARAKDAVIQTELDKLSALLQAKLLANAHTWAPGVLDKDGKLDREKFIDMLRGTTDVEKKLTAMSGLPNTVRKAILKQHETAVADAKANAGTWLTAGKKAVQQANEYVALGGLLPYLASQIKDPAQRKKAIELLQSKVAAGSTLELLVKALLTKPTIDLDGGGVAASDKALLSTIHSYVSSQGQSQIPIILNNIWGTLQSLLNFVKSPKSN